MLWDTLTRAIVCNESSIILRSLNNSFNAFAEHPDVDLYPDVLRGEIDEVNSWVLPFINDGVYRCGFAVSQNAYDLAMTDLYTHLDKAENILSKQRFLCGERFTEADLRMFVTLIRFDEVYAVYFKTNRKLIREYPNLLDYTREVFQMSAIRDTVDFDHIKNHYFTSHPPLNTYAIVPQGIGVGIWDMDCSSRKRFCSN